MDQESKLKLKIAIKKDLIKYYENMKSNLDITAQNLLMENSLESKVKEISNENVFLSEQIDKVCDSNLNDINEYFDDFNSFEVLTDNNKVSESSIKEEIKKKALKSYLVCIESDDYPDFDLYLQFEWYIDKKQFDYLM